MYAATQWGDNRISLYLIFVSSDKGLSNVHFSQQVQYITMWHQQQQQQQLCFDKICICFLGFTAANVSDTRCCIWNSQTVASRSETTKNIWLLFLHKQCQTRVFICQDSTNKLLIYSFSYKSYKLSCKGTQKEVMSSERHL